MQDIRGLGGDFRFQIMLASFPYDIHFQMNISKDWGKQAENCLQPVFILTN